jgi:hypothetical protein
MDRSEKSGFFIRNFRSVLGSAGLTLAAQAATPNFFEIIHRGSADWLKRRKQRLLETLFPSRI